MKNTQNMDIINKVKLIISTIEIEIGQTEFVYFEEMMTEYFSGDSDYPLIKEKVDNFITLIQKESKTANFQNFLDLDFEEDIWNLI